MREDFIMGVIFMLAAGTVVGVLLSLLLMVAVHN